MLRLLLLLSQPSLATEIVYQATLQGGVSVDGSGVSTPYDGSTTWVEGDELQVQVPSSATVTAVYVILHAKWSGFLADTASNVAVNDIPLDSATLELESTRYQVYSLDPDVYGITGAGSYPYAETGAVEADYHSGYGVGGAVLAVVYQDSTLTGRRHVVIGVDDVGYGTATVDALPASGTTGELLLSYGILWECSDEQNGYSYLDSDLFSSTAGGRDDGDPTMDASCGDQDWNSLFTTGSFGFTDDDLWTGLEGDDPDAAPVDGTSTNSRLDDELWALPYDESGDLLLGYYDSTSDSVMESFVIAIELDSDQDGTADRDDNCPDTYNPDQADTDADGLGDACDECTDVDGDGYGSVDFTTDTCADDCDDADASIHPGAAEIWYDGVDQDCDGASDYDADGDGFDSDATGGTDCDDSDASINTDAAETWYDGVDQDCDGASDYDADGDGFDSDAFGGDDCNDDDAEINPDGSDTWYDGVDGDCDGLSDYDADRDGHDSDEYGGDDCNDDDADVNPDTTETWYDGVDSDCDGASDYDADGDGHDSDAYGGDDCDDGDDTIHPDASDTWYDGVDSDCDGASDYDADGDGHDSDAYGGDDCDDTDAATWEDCGGDTGSTTDGGAGDGGGGGDTGSTTSPGDTGGDSADGKFAGGCDGCASAPSRGAGMGWLAALLPLSLLWRRRRR